MWGKVGVKEAMGESLEDGHEDAPAIAAIGEFFSWSLLNLDEKFKLSFLRFGYSTDPSERKIGFYKG